MYKIVRIYTLCIRICKYFFFEFFYNKSTVRGRAPCGFRVMFRDRSVTRMFWGRTMISVKTHKKQLFCYSQLGNNTKNVDNLL